MNWLTKREFIDSIAMGQITPGPILITATFIGYKLGYIFGGNAIINGVFGAFIATISIFLPSSVVIIFFSRIYYFIKKNMTVKLIIKGFKIGIIGLICYSGYIIMFEQLESLNILSLSICLFSFIILNKTKVHPLFLIITFGLLGYFLEI